MRTAYLLLMILAVPCSGQLQTAPPVLVIADGGTNGRMESIFIPPIANAPFTLTLLTEWSRPFANGGTYTLTNQRRIARDGKGRIYEERWLLVPKGGKMASVMDVRQFADPNRHTLYNCFTDGKVCQLVSYSGSTQAVYKPATAPTGPLPDGTGFHQHEDLGVANTNGVDTTGYRETTTINPGVMGNDQPMISTREFWYSAQLGINLISKVDTPQSGKQVFNVKDLTTSEPDPALFELPEGYKIVDRIKE